MRPPVIIPPWFRLLDLFLLCPLYFFPYSRLSSYLFLLQVLCLISSLRFPCASVWENTRARVFPIAILYGTFSFRKTRSFRPKSRLSKTNYHYNCSCSLLCSSILFVHFHCTNCTNYTLNGYPDSVH